MLAKFHDQKRSIVNSVAMYDAQLKVTFKPLFVTTANFFYPHVTSWADSYWYDWILSMKICQTTVNVTTPYSVSFTHPDLTWLFYEVKSDTIQFLWHYTNFTFLLLFTNLRPDRKWVEFENRINLILEGISEAAFVNQICQITVFVHKQCYTNQEFNTQ